MEQKNLRELSEIPKQEKQFLNLFTSIQKIWKKDWRETFFEYWKSWKSEHWFEYDKIKIIADFEEKDNKKLKTIVIQEISKWNIKWEILYHLFDLPDWKFFRVKTILFNKEKNIEKSTDYNFKESKEVLGLLQKPIKEAIAKSYKTPI